MNVNQITIKKHLEDIHADITKYLPQIITYRAGVKQAETTFAPDYAAQAKRTALEKLAASAQNVRGSIQRHIESICDAAMNLEKQPFVEELSPTLALISVTKRQSPLRNQEKSHPAFYRQQAGTCNLAGRI